jgi:PleD family two-component response regulator
MLPATDRWGAKPLADRIRQAIKALTWPVENHRLQVTCSIGITSPSPGSERHVMPNQWCSLLEQRLKEADFALYYGKEHGRDQTHLFQALLGNDGVREGKAAPYVLRCI